MEKIVYNLKLAGLFLGGAAVGGSIGAGILYYNKDTLFVTSPITSEQQALIQRVDEIGRRTLQDYTKSLVSEFDLPATPDKLDIFVASCFKTKRDLYNGMSAKQIIFLELKNSDLTTQELSKFRQFVNIVYGVDDISLLTTNQMECVVLKMNYDSLREKISAALNAYPF